jgi:hypothetical protein
LLVRITYFFKSFSILFIFLWVNWEKAFKKGQETN